MPQKKRCSRVIDLLEVLEWPPVVALGGKGVGVWRGGDILYCNWPMQNTRLTVAQRV